MSVSRIYEINGTEYILLPDGTHAKLIKLMCKSTDEKPTDVPNATTLYEFDTGLVFVFDADTGNWLQQ